MSVRNIRWGILGAGRIAEKFAEAVRRVPGNVLVAAASRTPGRAAAFASRYNDVAAYDTYGALVQDPNVEAVYVSNIHMMHKEAALLALRAGKHVLCEKPMTINRSSVQEMADCARENKVFLMEAMWSVFLPAARAAIARANAGDIGRFRMMRGNFSFQSPFNPESRIFKKELAGGALLDVGVYSLSYVVAALGEKPERIVGVADLCPTGVDDLVAFTLQYPSGQIAAITNGCGLRMPGEMNFFGTEGSIRVPDFWDAREYTITRNGECETISFPHENGFIFELEEASRCIGEGKLESDLWPVRKTLATHAIMDALRRQWGVIYPGE